MPHPRAGAFIIEGKGPTESELAAQRRKTVTAAEIGEVPPPPPPPPPSRDVSRFIDDALTGVLQPSVPQPEEGRPQTFEGQQFVQDFLAQFGVEPTAQRVSEEGFGRTGTFDPNSTMGRLGFANAEQARRARRNEETFGPLKGLEVPLEGSIVITDEEGNPTARFFNLDNPEVQRAIEEGRFIQPIFGELAQTLQGGLPGGEEFYNVPIEQPKIELGRALSEFGTPQMYLESLSDFLDEKVFRDRPKIDDAFNEIDAIREEYEAFVKQVEDIEVIGPDPTFRRPGEETRSTAQERIDQAFDEAQAKIDALRDQIDNEFFSPSRGKREFAKARDIIEFDNPPLEELPFFKEVEPDLLGKATAEQKRVLDERFAGIQQPPRTAPPPSGDEARQEATFALFSGYVDGLGLAPEFRSWLLGQYNRYKGLWEQSGDPDFISWLNKILAGG